MQAVTGLDALAMVASELAAMFDCAILPTLREHYKPQTPNFKRLCKLFARRMNLPAEEWPRVTFPAAISIDNDKRHPHIRKTMLTPRFTPAEIEAARRAALAEHFEVRMRASATPLRHGRRMHKVRRALSGV